MTTVLKEEPTEESATKCEDRQFISNFLRSRADFVIAIDRSLAGSVSPWILPQVSIRLECRIGRFHLSAETVSKRIDSEVWKSLAKRDPRCAATGHSNSIGAGKTAIQLAACIRVNRLQSFPWCDRKRSSCGTVDHKQGITTGDHHGTQSVTITPVRSEISGQSGQPFRMGRW